jgi:hypothetical protein
MPRLVPFRLAAACALALFSLAAFAATAMAASVAQRVVGKNGKVISEDTVTIGGKVALKTSPKATCFGPGTGGSNTKVSLGGSTALGALARATQFQKALRPLLVTDHFLDEFGLGLCSIGGTAATTRSSWFFRVNHKVPSVGAEKAKLRGGDQVVWGYGSYPYPDELVLKAPANVQANVPFTVTVFAYDEKGKKAPAAGAIVTGASGPTNSSGQAMVTLVTPTFVGAKRGDDTPPVPQSVCVDALCVRR